MFEVFPIIMLTDQFDAINHAIVRDELSRDDVLEWFDFYGELIMPNQDHSLRTLPLHLPVNKTADGYALIYIFKSKFGKLDVFRFAHENNTLMLARPLSRGFYTNLEYSFEVYQRDK